MSKNTLQPSLRVKSSELVPAKEACLTKTSETKSEVQASIAAPSNDGAVCPDFKSVACAPRWMDISPSNTFSGSVSLDESMSTNDSLMSPEFKYTGNDDVASIKSIENRTSNILNISDSSKMAGWFIKGLIFYLPPFHMLWLVWIILLPIFTICNMEYSLCWPSHASFLNFRENTRYWHHTEVKSKWSCWYWLQFQRRAVLCIHCQWNLWKFACIWGLSTSFILMF